MKVISYGTPEFEEYLKSAPVSLEEAWDIQITHYMQTGQKPIGSPLFFIIDDDYVFTPYFNPKIPEVLLKGIAVNSRTGAVKLIDSNNKLKPVSQFGWVKN